MDLIADNVKTILPALDVDKVASLIAILEELGVSEISDLSLVEEKDFQGILKPIQARKLINAWKSSESPKVPVCEEERSSSSNANVNANHANANHANTNNANEALGNNKWADSFTLPWHKMPNELLDALKEKKRPKPSLRLDMIRIICKSISKVCANPGSAALRKIAQDIVMKYPESFGDIICEEIVCGGFASLSKQLIQRFQNLNRCNIFNSLKRKKKNEESGADADAKKIRTSDQYGCVNWQPSRLPENETNESQEKKKADMKSMFQQGPNIFKNSNFVATLNETYFKQRSEINNRKETGYLVNEWPLLFTTQGFLNHFDTLVGINGKEKLNSALVHKGGRILKYIETVPAGCRKKNVEAVLKESKTCGEICTTSEYIIFLIMAYFGEKRDSLFKTADNSTTAQEVKQMEDLPKTPCLIICGETEYSGTSFILCVDKIVINEDIQDFETGLLMLFAAFYVLNIQYPHTAAATLEYIQRCFLNINPSTGTKVSKEVKKKHQVFNAKVLTLLKGIADFEWISK